MVPPCSQPSQGSHLSQSKIHSPQGEDKACVVPPHSLPLSLLSPHSRLAHPLCLLLLLQHIKHTPPRSLERFLPSAWCVSLRCLGGSPLVIFKFLLPCHLCSEAFPAVSPALAQHPPPCFLPARFSTAVITLHSSLFIGLFSFQ